MGKSQANYRDGGQWTALGTPSTSREEGMNIEEALNTAIEYEERVMETYAEALAEAEDAVGKRIFNQICIYQGFRLILILFLYLE